MLVNYCFSSFLSRVRAGDQEAAAQLAREFKPVICRAIHKPLMHSGLGSVYDSMDICQSVLATFFARVTRGEFELHSPADVAKLLVTMARNVLRDHQRHFRAERHRRKEYNTEYLQNLVGMHRECSEPNEVLAQHELTEVIRQTMSHKEWRLATAWASGRTWDEIAAESGEKPNTLRMRLDRALARTRRLLTVSRSYGLGGLAFRS